MCRGVAHRVKRDIQRYYLDTLWGGEYFGGDGCLGGRGRFMNRTGLKVFQGLTAEQKAMEASTSDYKSARTV